MIVCFRWRDFFFKGWYPNYSGTNIHMYYLPRWTNISWLVWIILKFHQGWKNGTPPPLKRMQKKDEKERKYLCTISIPPVLNGAHSVFLHTRIHNTHWFFPSLSLPCTASISTKPRIVNAIMLILQRARDQKDYSWINELSWVFKLWMKKKTKGKYIYFFTVWIWFWFCIHVSCVHILTLVQALRSDFTS